MPSRRHRLFSICLLAWAGASVAAGLGDGEAVPHLSARGVESYREFLASGPHRAFAIAPGGAWAWRSELPSAELAERAALDDCRAHTRQTCVPYAVDDHVVFDTRTWPTLWGPYADAAMARQAPVGTRRGERFPDLVFRDVQGRAHKVADFRGKVLVLHFWGSWCPPCRRELPDLARLVKTLEKERDIRFVFLPVREPFKVAGDWLNKQHLELPLFDGGEKEFALAGGARIEDRRIAGKFPTTYVLDRHGLVVFSHVGDASRWIEYAPFLKDAARFSGR